MRTWSCIALLLCALAAAVPVQAQDSRNKGAVLEGTVINKRTQRFLERALVRVLNTELSALTDTNGQFRIAGLTAGNYDVTASYTGLGETTMTVKMTDGAVTRAEFELTAVDVYVSNNQFEVEVTSPLEGVAHAINEQRRGETLRTVVSVDAFIDQTTGNPGEFLRSVPGIQMDYSQNEPQTIRVRGFDPNLTTVTLDGNSIASAASSSTNRALQVDQLSLASISEVEVFKAPISSMSANSIGGVVNFNTKSAFEQQGRRLTLQLGANVDGHSFFNKYAGPGHGEEARRGAYPIGRFTYSESFFKNRLGLVVTTGRDYTNQLGSSVTHNLNVTGTPAPPTPFTVDNSTVRRGAMSFAPNRQLRVRNDIGVNTDFKLTKTTVLFFRSTYWYYKSTNRNHGWTLTPGALAAGATATDYTTTAGTASQGASVFDKFTRTFQLNPGMKFRSGPWQIDLNYALSKSVNQYKNDDNFGALAITLPGLNWTMSTPLDREEPTQIIQNSGLDFYDLNNYRPNQGDLRATAGEHRANHGGIVSTNFRHTWDAKHTFRFDTRRDFNTRRPFYLKAGLAYNQGIFNKTQPQKRWYWMGEDGVATADDLTAAGARLGRFAEPVPVTMDLSDYNPREPTYLSLTRFRQYWRANPQVLQENLAYSAQQNFVGNQFVDEKVSAGYFMGSITINKLNLLAGLRVERTDIEARGFRVLPTTGTSPDRVDLKGKDPNSLEGILATYRFKTSQFNYTSRPFPAVHVKYEWLRSLQIRASYTEAIGRPNLGDVLPNFTQNDTLMQITTNRTGLLPQRSKNYDASVEYYTKSAGEWTAGWFRRDVSDYLSTATIDMTPELLEELNLGPEYANYDVVTRTNLGFAKWSGYELAFRQQLRDWAFVPKLLGGMQFFGNFTHLYKVEGDFGSVAPGTKITTLANLVPKLFNAGISYRVPNGRFYTSLLTNYQSVRYTQNLPALTAAAQRFPRQEAYQFWNLEMSYILTPKVQLLAVGRNLFGERPRFSELGIIRNKQQDTGTAWMFAVRFDLGSSK